MLYKYNQFDPGRDLTSSVPRAPGGLSPRACLQLGTLDALASYLEKHSLHGHAPSFTCIFIARHHPAHRRIVHAKVLGNGRHGVLS